jgi:hypothetical protein
MCGPVDSARARAQRYREFAAEAERRAAATLFGDVRALFAKVAREWRMLADEADSAADIDSLTDRRAA